ncbi:MAG: glycine oxidase ThiO [Thermogemmatispora sp.]|jgi:glycine oxidase|uniref:glycine oxidase n=1 Tax=Thermogemmatispora aurantia TaxID=2045279 RepID=A0A5J4K5M2_9CHLR|nr:MULTISPECIES: glycine oxidase ThiO [Thermogemmatispora]MBE3566470.1 glycine oxidase ThiO [Thermogemmatispora sp.]GER81426.1 glycine oxidase ThiO [Thermogemmatispora aurantia]
MHDQADVVIIGAGVIGWSIAYYLRRAGVDVCLLEQAKVGAGASAAAAGLLAPLGPLNGPGPMASLLLAGCSLLPELVAELEASSGLQIELEQRGALRLACETRAVARLQRRLAYWQPLGLQLSWLSGEEARRREPLLSAEVEGAVYAPQEGQLRARELLKALAWATRQAGARCYESCEVCGLRQRAGRVLAVQTKTGEEISCGSLVIAAGAWSARCCAWLGYAVPVRPVRGQLLSLRPPAGLPALRHLIFGRAIYLIPRRDGSLTVGATREEAGFEARVTTEGVAWLLAQARRLVPMLTDATLEDSWAGLRPTTPDGLPILGLLPGWQNVLLATGHGSVGVMLSAITGQLISDLICTGRRSPLLLACGPERFDSLTSGT